MGYMDRGYYRDRPPVPGGVGGWLMFGQLPLFTVFGISVRAHSSLLIYLVLTLFFGLGPQMPWQDKLISAGVIFLIVLLHEFGHCFSARWVGGSANDIVMHPLGGLAMTAPPPRPIPHLITTIGGPAINVIICIICGTIVWQLFGWLPWNPFFARSPRAFSTWFDIGRYAYWIYQISWTILLFNLLPIFPLDGGRVVQEVLWIKLGYYRSMVISCTVGIVGSVAVGLYSLATGNMMLFFLAVMGFMYCMQQKRFIQMAGPGEFADQTDYSAAYDIHGGHPHMKTRKQIHRAAKRAKKLQEQEQAEQQKIDVILAKVSAHGMNSLSWWEKRTLKKATEHQRQRDADAVRSRDR